ncbi:MAG: hypothetical protein ACO4AU_15765 [bacterium]|jgi:2-phosphoglycerate kinase
MLVIKPDQKREPFVRGIFAHKLIQRGLPFEQAYQVAKDAKLRLSGKKEVRSEQLTQLADKLVKERYGEKVLQQLQPVLPYSAKVIVQHPNSSAPFSKGLLAQSITASGLNPEEAHRIASEIEQNLFRRHRTLITNHDLFKLVTETIRDYHGKRTASLYELTSRLDQLDRPVILLLAGASGTGKSTLATALATRLGINQVIGSDSIREIMRMAFSKEILPTLHCSTVDVGETLELPGTKQGERVIAGFLLQSQQVNVGVQAVIARSIEERLSVVLEGIHLLPAIQQVLENPPSGAYIVPVIATLINEKAHRERFIDRGKLAQSRSPEHYLEHFRSIRKIHDHYVEFGNGEDLDLINNENFDLAINELAQTVVSSLHEQVQAGEKQRRN